MRYSGLILLVVFVIAFSFALPGVFLTATTFRSIASEQSITIILALGLLVCLTAGVFDLSIAQNLGFGTVLLLKLSMSGVPIALAVVSTVVVCALVGTVNAILVVVIGIDGFIATLAMSSVLLALTLLISNSQYVGPGPEGFGSVLSPSPLGIPMLLIYALVLCAGVWYVVEHTVVGRRLGATGANPGAARLSGIPTKRYMALSLVFAGLIAGVASVLLSAKLGTVSPTIGPSYLLPTFAACFLATTQVRPGRFNVLGLLVAVFLLATGVKGLQLLGGQVWIPPLFNGVALLVAVGLTVVLSRLQIARAKKRADLDLAASHAVTVGRDAEDVLGENSDEAVSARIHR